MLPCENTRELLSDYLDGTLDSAGAVAVRDHLEECAGCRREQSALKNTIAMLHDSPVPNGGAARRSALSHLRSAVKPAPAPRLRFHFTGYRLAAASALALSLIWLAAGRDQLQITTLPGASPDATVALGHALPTSNELDEMASLHAVHSFAIAAGDSVEQQETLADATSRLSVRTP